jgi:hypothetical protein
LATDTFGYLSYPETVALHIELTRYLGEIRYGIFEWALAGSTALHDKACQTRPARLSSPHSVEVMVMIIRIRLA